MASEGRDSPLAKRPPVVIVGGFLSWPSHYRGLAADVHELSGLDTHIVNVTPADWLGALFFGRTGQLVFEISTVIDKVLLTSDSSRVVLVGHSAGGIAAKVCVGGIPPYGGRRYSGHRRVSHLITLGSPHRVREVWPFEDIHRANTLFPGALHENISYTSVAGAAVRGSDSRRAAGIYEKLYGERDIPGDGVIPVESALLDGSRQIVLEDIAHDRKRGSKWYGSGTEVVSRWWPDELTKSVSVRSGAREGGESR